MLLILPAVASLTLSSHPVQAAIIRVNPTAAPALLQSRYQRLEEQNELLVRTKALTDKMAANKKKWDAYQVKLLKVAAMPANDERTQAARALLPELAELQKMDAEFDREWTELYPGKKAEKPAPANDIRK